MRDKQKTTRRQFLLGRAAVEAIGGSAARAADGSSAACGGARAADPAPSYLLQITRRAMACQFAVLLNAGQPERAAETALRALDLVETLEAQLSVYRAQSQISAINRRAASEPVAVGARLFPLLQLALQLHAATGGAFDITAGPLSKVWGFHRRQGRVPTQPELEAALQRVGSQWLVLDPQQRTIRFNRQGVEINLGAIGKGYALDRCGELFLDAGIDSYCLHGGQSSVAARGDRAGGPPENGGWTVGLKHPLRPNRRLAEIHLRDRALATSGGLTQSFRYRGRRLGHILDPRTGRPAEGVLSATVLAPDAATADALATAFYVMGADEAIRFCADRPELAAIIVVPGPRDGAVQLQTIGLADDDWSCLGD